MARNAAAALSLLSISAVAAAVRHHPVPGKKCMLLCRAAAVHHPITGRKLHNVAKSVKRAKPATFSENRSGIFHKTIADLESGSMYAAFSREANTKLGLKVSFCVYSEYGSASDDELFRTMDSTMAPAKISGWSSARNPPMTRLRYRG
jgi:predicted transcriptional regulator